MKHHNYIFLIRLHLTQTRIKTKPLMGKGGHLLPRTSQTIKIILRNHHNHTDFNGNETH